MQPLTPAELKKNNSNTGESRIDILLEAITKGLTLADINEDEFKLKNNKFNTDAIVNFKKEGKAFDLEKDDGTIISSSKIGKSALFGGGSGAGGGTDQTAIAEALQCVYCQIILDRPNITLDKINKSIQRSAFSKVEVGSTTFEQCYNLDSKWHASAYFGAKKLYNDGYINSNHIFHRDSSVMTEIYNNAKKAFKNSNLIALTPDKWNPGDIWAVDKNLDVKKLNTNTIQEYNSELLKRFKNRTLVGISLKKVEREKFIKTAEVNQTAARPSGLKFNQSLISGKTNRSNFYSSKGGEVSFSKQGGTPGSFDVRANSSLGTLKAEITGKTARQGGAGWGKIQEYVETYASSTYKLPNNDTLKQEARMIKAKNTTKLESFFNKAKTLDSSLDKKEFMREIPKKDLAWIHAKLGVTYFLYTLKKNKANKKSDAIVNSIYNYAGSQSKLSSVHMKVYE